MRGLVKVIAGVLIAALIVGVGVAGWLLGRHHDDSSPTSQAAAIKVGVPTIVSPATLKQFAGSHYPLYWAGTRSGTKIELTLTAHNGVFVRYLPTSAQVGTKDEYLTVATYDSIDAYNALTAAKPKVASVTHADSGAAIAVFKERPLSTYFSFPSATFQVEVFSPKAGESKSLTDEGAIKLLGDAS